MLTAEDVFITTGFPEHTYVALAAGAKENELRDGLAQKNMIISISGPSKSGKTTLCDRVFGKDKGLTHIYVTGEKRNLTIIDPHFYFFLRNYDAL